MAVTRINNNQISDASAGNSYVGINASTKLQPYTVTSTKLANNLTYGSDLTITGNLTVQGNTTTIDTTYTTIEDPILLLASNQTGSPTVDIGFVGQRGTSQNIAFVWDESAGQFITAYTTTGESNTTISIASYADLHTGNANIGGNIVINGTTSLVGSVIGNVSLAGNITMGNVLTSGQVSAGGNVTGGNLVTGGIVTATGNIVSSANINATSAFVNAGAVLASGRVEAGTSMSAAGNITGGNILTGGLVSSTGNITSAANVAGGNVIATTLVTGASVTGTTISASANITGGNLLTGGLVSSTGNITSAANVAGGNVIATTIVSAPSHIGTIVSVSANITGGNILTGGLISATGNITSAANVSGGNLLTGGLVSSTGNITSAANVAGGNVIATTIISGASVLGTIVSASANITGGNLITGGAVLATGNVSATANVLGGNLVATTAVVTPTVIGTTVTVSSTGGLITLAPSSNVSVNSKNINSLADPVQSQDAATKAYVDNMASTQLAYHTSVAAATTGTLETATGGTITYTQPNGNGVGALLTVSGGSFNLIDTANIQTVGTRVLVKNQANTALNGVYTWANATNLVRSTDADTYGPNSSTDLSINDYFFVTSGNVNAGSAWVVDAPSGTITFGTSGITFAQFSSSQTYTANTSAGISITGTVISAKTDNNTTAFDGSGNIIVKAGANLTTPNIGAATGTSLSVTGNLTGAGANISGNVSGGNILATTIVSGASHIGSIVSVSANITGGNLLTGGLISATGNITSAANISGGNVLATTIVSGASHIGSIVSVSANITGGNILTGGLISATGNITSAANVAGGNVLATTIVSGASHIGSIVSVSANITGGNILTGGIVSATGNIIGASKALIGVSSTTLTNPVAVFSGSGASYDQVAIINSTGTGSADLAIYANNGDDSQSWIDVGFTGNVFSDTNYSITTPGDGYLFAQGNTATGGNLVISTGNIGNTRDIVFGFGFLSTNEFVRFQKSTNTILPYANTTANIGSSSKWLSNVYAVNHFGTTVSATANVIGANVNTVSMTLNGSTINSNAARITVNSNSSDVDFAVNGTGANIFYIDAGTNTASFGSATQTTNAIVAFNATNSVLMPVGNTAQRPGTGVTGMLRFNTTTNGIEVYDNSAWTSVGTPTFTVITDQQFNGDGATVAFTLSAAATTNSTIVSINGVVQIPTLAYSVSSTTLTFTEAPQTGDLIDVRVLTTTTQVTSISNSPGNAVVSTNPTSNVVEITGSLSVNNIINSGANGTGNIGNSTTYFNTVFAKSTSAQYADLAEVYTADAEYVPGTVLSFGGTKEVTMSTVTSDTRIAGVVSTNPSYVMNATLESEYTATVALTGRVPTLVSGPVAKGDMMVSAGNGRAIACSTPAIGTVIGKALENHSNGDGVIEVVVGRL